MIATAADLLLFSRIDEAQAKGLSLSSPEGETLVADVVLAVKTGADASRSDLTWLRAAQHVKDHGGPSAPDPGGVTAIWSRLQSWTALLLKVHAACASEVLCITSISTGLAEIPAPGPIVPFTFRDCDVRWTILSYHFHSMVLADDNGDEELVRLHAHAASEILKQENLYTTTKDYRLQQPTDLFGKIQSRLGQILQKYDIDYRRDRHVSYSNPYQTH